MLAAFAHFQKNPDSKPLLKLKATLLYPADKPDSAMLTY
jgi:hypothetical protein